MLRTCCTIVLLASVTASACKRTKASESDGGTGSEAAHVSSFEASPLSSGDTAMPLSKDYAFARAMELWVYEEPSTTAKKIGYLRAGAAFELRGSAVAGAEGCTGGFLPIVPRGFVCIGSAPNLAVTRDAADPIVRASTRRPERSSGLPYGYAVVRNAGAPFYTRVPTDAEARGLEQDWDLHFATLEQAEAKEAKEGAYPQLSSMPSGTLSKEPSPGVIANWATDGKDDEWSSVLGESFLKNAETVPDLSGLALLKKREACTPQALARGEKSCIPLDASRPMKRLGISFIASLATATRRYVLTPDMLLMPADRVRLVRGTSFQGTELAQDSAPGVHLPIVFVIREGVRKFTLEGKKLVQGDVLPFRVALEATLKERVVGKKHYHVLKSGELVASKDAVRLDPIRKMPKWAKEGERWLEINLTKQTLLAVDGEKPTYATLVSTGAGGSSDDAEKNPYLTPRGIFRIHTKHVSSTMDSKQPEAEFELRDVPYIQYFQDGYALHAAYWHDQFGLPRSHGCINLAPKDAAKLFAFTKPEVPEAWHGAMLPLKGTIVWVHP
jgi:L,D-transpeptidase catalytic domain